MNKTLLMALGFGAASFVALAQDAAAPVTDSGLSPAAAPCAKPDITELSSASDGATVATQDATRIKSTKKTGTVSDFQKKFDDYRTCIVTYATNQGNLAKQHQTLANNAVNELNAFVAEANKAQGRQ